MSRTSPEPLPPYSYVPGSAWPHPVRSAEGHLHGRERGPAEPIRDDAWRESAVYLHGIALFNAGYYWEAHEAWEALWHAHGRTGAIAWVIQALIKLAAAGVKVREGRPAGVRTHASRAAELLERAMEVGGQFQLGLDLTELTGRTRSIALDPPLDESPRDARVVRVFRFDIEPRPMHYGSEDSGSA